MHTAGRIRARAASSFWMLAAAAAALVVVTRWPYRSIALFSWDSANFALALDHIDIRAHQPHPPGYLGLVFAARALRPLVNDANQAMVLWNIVASVLAVGLGMRLAWELSPVTSRARVSVATALVLITSPALWFYGVVAEVYVSEMLVTLLVGFLAWRTIQGTPKAIVWCAAALAVAVLVKVSAAVFMMPLAAFAWSRSPRRERWASCALLAISLVALGGLFLLIQPDLPALTLEQLRSSTTDTRMVASDGPNLRALNRNGRELLAAVLSALGVVNIIVLPIMARISRGPTRAPIGPGRAVSVLWICPWLAVWLLVHFAKPGYVLPLLPLASVLVAGWSSTLGNTGFRAWLFLQTTVNVATFVLLAPPSIEAVGGDRPYREKPFVERVLGDLRSATVPTAATIRASDASVQRVHEVIATTCPSGRTIIVAGRGSPDWRRLMWYFPNAQVVRTDGPTVASVALSRKVTAVQAEGVMVATACPVLWILDEDGRRQPLTPSNADAIAGLGFSSGAGTFLLTPSGVAPEPKPKG